MDEYRNVILLSLCNKIFQNGTGDANDVWRVEIVGGKDGDVVQTVTTKVKFHHYFMKCVISCSGKQLPKWGYEQQEIACNPTTRDPNAQWNVEDNFYPRLPNVSFQNFAPGFVSRFLESHRVMLQGNAGLKPKEGEYTSRPWEWPINLRVSTCYSKYLQGVAKITGHDSKGFKMIYSWIRCSDCSSISFRTSSSTASLCLIASLML